MATTHDPWPEIPWIMPEHLDFVSTLKHRIRRQFEKLDDRGYGYPDYAPEEMLDRILGGLTAQGYRVEDIEKTKCQTS